VNAGLAFVITWMIAHGLGAGATGSFFQLTSLFMIATCIIGLGADTGLVRSLSRHVAQNDHGAIRPLLRSALIPLVVIGMVATCTVVIAAPWISSALGWGSDAASTVRVLALVLLPAAATGVLLGGSRGLGRIRTYTVVQNLLIPIVRFGAVAFAVYVVHDAWAVVWAWSLPLVLGAVAASALLVRHVRRGPAAEAPHAERDERRRLAREFWGFSLPRGGTVILERALDWADVLLVIALLGAVPGGVYGVVTRIVQAGNMLESALRIVMGPRLSAAVARDDQIAADSLYQKVTGFLILASWPFYFAIAVFAKDILRLFGDEFVSGATALVVLALAMAVRNTGGALQTVLLMAGQSTWQLGNKALQLTVLIVLTLWLAPVGGITGAAVAYAISVVVDTGLAMFQVHRALGFRSDARAVIGAAVAPVGVVLGGGLLVSVVLEGMGTPLRLLGLGGVLAAYLGAILLALRKRGEFHVTDVA
jgi:O-antigen/teichoic acid export membrane protein